MQMCVCMRLQSCMRQGCICRINRPLWALEELTVCVCVMFVDGKDQAIEEVPCFVQVIGEVYGDTS